ncbi:MAG: RNA 3'-terminal phosphate cyclase [Kofleriaceae bacterium]
MTEPVDIDGSRGEGGGQILRTSLALSMITGKPLVMRNIRAGRAKPGLRRQHLACVHAARDLCGATAHGDDVGSKYLEFTPAALVGGTHTVDIGTMGSSTLVVQTVLLPMIAGGHALRLVIRGGTHNPMAPPFEFLDRVFLPLLRAMGANVSMTLDRHGFLGERGDLGQITVEIGDATKLSPIELVDAPPITSRHATAILARLPTHIADREFGIVIERLGWSRAECEVRETRYGGPGNALLLEVERGALVREIVSEIGEKGVRAELVATRACEKMANYLEANVPVGEHLADQLILPLALAGGGRFACAPLSLHATTNIETIGRFLDVPIRDERQDDAVLVSVG